MQKFEDPKKVENRVQFYDMIKSPIYGSQGISGKIAILITELKDSIYREGQNINNRWEAYKTEKGWYVYLVAEFKDSNFRMVFQFELTPESEDLENNKRFLVGLCRANGKWALKRPGLEGSNAIANLIGKNLKERLQVDWLINGSPMGMPKIVDIKGLQKLLEKV